MTLENRVGRLERGAHAASPDWALRRAVMRLASDAELADLLALVERTLAGDQAAKREHAEVWAGLIQQYGQKAATRAEAFRRHPPRDPVGDFLADQDDEGLRVLDYYTTAELEALADFLRVGDRQGAETFWAGCLARYRPRVSADDRR